MTGLQLEGGAVGGSSGSASPYIGPSPSGRYQLPGVNGAIAPVSGYRTWLPQWVGYTGVVNGLSIEVTVLAAGFVRVGMYADDDGVPGALLADGGALDCSSTGIKTAAVNVAVTPNLYWFVGWVTGTSPTIRVCAGASANQFPQPSLNPGSSVQTCFRESGLAVDGALPASAPSVIGTTDRYGIWTVPSFA